MASDVVARDKVMNIQFIKLWRTKLLWRPFGGEILFMLWRVRIIAIMIKKNSHGEKLRKN